MSDSVALATTPKARLIEQLKLSGGGIFAATLAVPVVIAQWTPTWFAAGWGVAYFGQTLFFLAIVSFLGPAKGRHPWSIVTSLLFASISASVPIWGHDNPGAPWIAAVISFAYISFEIAVLPYLEMKRWYQGSLLAGFSMVVMASITVHPLVAVAITPLLISMTLLAGRNKQAKDQLDVQLGQAEQELFTDSLTGLLNRRGLEVEIDRMSGSIATIAKFDADRFKLINDTQGHGVGDQALRMIADHLTATLPTTWKIARHGGDEFVAVSPGFAQLSDDTVVPFQMALTDRPGNVRFSMSVGLASGELNETGDRLMSEAGHALRHAKRDGCQVVRSEGELRDRFERSVSIAASDNAEEHIVPVAQVIVDDHGVVGCELLARWQNHDGTLLAPGQFMDMLIENGLLGRLDDVMLEHAARLAADLERRGVDIYVSANIAASHLLDPGLIDRVQELLATYDLSPDRLMVEITESERLSSNRRWESAVIGLRKLGIKLAIDDFGAGYSSVARLQNLPITHLKLDRSLVTGATGPLGEIVRGVTRFCDASNIGVIAEGVETVEDHLSMRDAKVSYWQGYLFGRPMRIDDFLRDLADRRDQAPAHSSEVQHTV